MDWMSRLSAASNIIISSIILHTSFRRVCWPPYCPMYYTREYYNAYVAFCREPSQSLDSYFSFKRPKGMGQAGISFDHRGSSSPGHGEELTACGRAAALCFLFSLACIRENFLDMDKNIHKYYNIHKYNTKGNRRSAHHPKGGVKYDRTDYDVACCA